jgi:hypothetical protein
MLYLSFSYQINIVYRRRVEVYRELRGNGISILDISFFIVVLGFSPLDSVGFRIKDKARVSLSVC